MKRGNCFPGMAALPIGFVVSVQSPAAADGITITSLGSEAGVDNPKLTVNNVSVGADQALLLVVTSLSAQQDDTPTLPEYAGVATYGSTPFTLVNGASGVHKRMNIRIYVTWYYVYTGTGSGQTVSFNSTAIYGANDRWWSDDGYAAELFRLDGVDTANLIAGAATAQGPGNSGTALSYSAALPLGSLASGTYVFSSFSTVQLNKTPASTATVSSITSPLALKSSFVRLTDGWASSLDFKLFSYGGSLAAANPAFTVNWTVNGQVSPEAKLYEFQASAVAIKAKAVSRGTVVIIQ